MGRKFELIEDEPYGFDMPGCHGTAMVVMAVVSVVSGALSYKAAQSAASSQKKMAEANAQRIAAEKAEQLRKMTLQQAQTLSQAQAAAAASGMSVEGSQKTYIEQMRESFKAEQDWLQTSSASQQAITRQEGKMQADVSIARGQQAFVQGVGQAASYWG
jgi:aconitase B